MDVVDHASFVLLITKDGLYAVFVKDPTKPHPLFWGLPGGHREGDETPGETALREVLEEAISKPSPFFHLELIFKELRDGPGGRHRFYLFKVEVDEDLLLRERGDDGEMIAVFSLDYVREHIDEFLPSHVRILSVLGFL